MMSPEPLTAVYLAAGEGKRLAPLTDERPKAMLEIGETTLAERALRSLRAAGVERVLAITGHQKRAFEELGDLIDELRFNPRYDRANNVYSLWSASDVVARGCYIVNSDVLFEQAIAQRLVAADGSAVLCAADHGVDEESMKVTSSDGLVTGLSKQAPIDSNPEYIGLTRIAPEHGPLLAQILEGYIGRGDVDGYYEDAIEQLAADVPVGLVSVDGLAWIEIDDHDDLALARDRVLKRVEAACS
jgi:choline kinase